MTSRPELAPFGVLRVAAWPVEALDAFGSMELANACARGAAPAALYESVLASERQALWRSTVFDERFMKALALSNPTLGRSVREHTARHPGAERAPANKRTRHLETTLYRLLARAVSRTDPLGAWCGVGVVRFGETTALRRVTPSRAVAPDLAFYATVLAALGRQSEARRTAHYRVNPTLGRAASGGWSYWAPPAVGRGRVSLAADPLLDAALTRLGDLGRFTIEGAERALDVAPGTLDGFFFGQLVPQGILVGGLCLPTFFSDPWDAIRQIEDERGPHAAWRRLSDGLRAICTQTEDQYDVADSRSIARLVDRASACGAAFAAELGLGELPPLGLHLDSGAPFELTLGRAFRARLELATIEDEADVSGSVRASNESLRRVQCALLGPEGVPLAGLDESSLAFHQRERTGWPVVAEADYFAELPLRTVLAQLVRGDVADHPGIASLTLLDDAAGAISRFVPCLAAQDAEGTAGLVDWLRRAHAGCRSPRLVALGEPHPRVPNAAAQPDLGLPRRSLWGATRDDVSLAGARIAGFAERGQVVIAMDGETFAVMPLAAQNLAAGDPVMQLLLMSSGRFPPPDGGNSSGGLRTIAPAEIDAMTRKHGRERFVAWCLRVSSAYGHAIVHRAGATPLRVPVTSPLAVAALLEGASGGFDVEPAITQPFVGDANEHYLAQLVVPFGRR